MEANFIDRNYTKGRGGKSPEFVVIHTYGGPGTNLYPWFNNPVSKVSAHFSVEYSGLVRQYVREEDTAWHAGNFDVNQRSIGIEHQDNGDAGNVERTDKLYESSISLIVEIYKKYGWDTKNKGLIKPHNEFVDRACPGGLSLERIRDGVYKKLNYKEDKNRYESFEELIMTQREDVKRAVEQGKTTPREWWKSHGEIEFAYTLGRRKRPDVLEWRAGGGDLMDWYFHHGSKEYPNIWDFNN